MKRFIPTLLLAILWIASTGCGGFRSQTSRNIEPSDTTATVRQDIIDEAVHYADSVINTLSLEEKTSQLLLPAVYSSADSYNMKLLRRYAEMGIGGVILLKGDMESAACIADSLTKWGKVPPFIAIDAEFGLAMRLKDAPSFPINAEIADDTDENLMYDYGREVARECRLLGINMVLGPVLDVAARNSVMGIRSLGTNPTRVADLAVAYAKGLESGNVISVAKHFPGHGAAEGDSHHMRPTIKLPLHSLDSIHLYPFRRYIEQGLSAVMVGHLAFPAIDPQSLPAALSPTVVTDLLRNDLRFKGLIITDALNMKGAEGISSDHGIIAGADLITAPTDTKVALYDILNALKKGKITEGRINESLRRILIKKYLISKYAPQNHMDGESLLQLANKETEAISKKLAE